MKPSFNSLHQDSPTQRVQHILRSILEPFVLERMFVFIQHYLHFDTRVQNESNKIWMFWNLGTTVIVLDDHPQFLHVRVQDPKLARPIVLTSVYIFCEAIVRKNLWKGIHCISCTMDDPWLIGEDFNVIAW